ncbi:MAG: glycosyltransferase [Roseiarcus sp.]
MDTVLDLLGGLAYDPTFAGLAPGLAAVALFVAARSLWPAPTAFSRVALLAVGWVLMARYAWWRFTETLPAFEYSLEFAVGAAFLFTEAGAMMSALLASVFLSRLRDRSKDADANARWLAEVAQHPLVDVLICSYNEEAAILERTIVGALAMGYPNYRVWMCDDSRRPWLKDLSDRLGCRYVTRPDNRHAKAGNINHALGVLATLDDPPQFISILDADFVPETRFLSRAMTLFRDPRVGVVQTPQHFINPDPIQMNLGMAKFWPDEQRLFFDTILACKDAWGAAFCCGTSSIIRFAPLRAIGGFPTDSVTEDYLVTLRLKEIGYVTVYLNEPLTHGLAPEGLVEYVVQRARWRLGFMQIVRGRSGPLSLRSALSFIDRLSLAESFLNWAAVYLSRVIGIAIPVLSLLLDIHPFRASVDDVATHFLPYFLWQSLVMHWLTRGRFVPILSDVSQLIVAPQIVRAVFVGLLAPQGQKFQVTAKGGDRRRGFVEWGLMRPFLVAILASLAAVIYAFDVDGSVDTVRFSAPALAWCWYNLIILLLLCFVCVEQPRPRRAERFESSELVRTTWASGEKIFQLADISITGARMRGVCPVAIGERMALSFSDSKVAADVVRIERDAFAVAFDQSFASRVAMTRHFYGGGYVRPLGNIRLVRVGAALARRLFE